MTTLRAEYENGSQSFVKQIDWLMSQGWIGIRRTRGDGQSVAPLAYSRPLLISHIFTTSPGDCFYRSFAFAYIERMLNATEPQLAVLKALSVLETTPSMLEQVGFQTLVFEDFYDAFASPSLIVRPSER
ncbi:hypothetical protein NUW54_g12016 [Trametes sanguinea]|uniref:Uncharacterized protein n=1 Tax=Trametes sanguinea TaxID=158606 RepID=A0ACC1N3Z7_9APHY|nr:hypothetical protein NUW54_g12016 [Trametes sanguinea]